MTVPILANPPARIRTAVSPASGSQNVATSDADCSRQRAKTSAFPLSPQPQARREVEGDQGREPEGQGLSQHSDDDAGPRGAVGAQR